MNILKIQDINKNQIYKYFMILNTLRHFVSKKYWHTL